MEKNTNEISDVNHSLFFSFFQLSVNVLMVFLPSTGYFFQGIKFKQTKSSKGFSKTLCLLLLLANILRIFFWIGKKFALTLLYQSIIVIISQIYLIHYFLKYQDISQKELIPEKSLINHFMSWKDVLNPTKIWNWDYEIDYYKFIFVLFFIFSIMCSLAGIENIKFFDLLGTISVSIETFIEIPQIRQNCITKNTKNLSGTMVVLWLLGDLFKTTYNIVYKSPIQMILGGIIQNCEDIILSSQVMIYGDTGPFSKIFRNKYKYVNLNLDDDGGEKTGDGKLLMNDKISFENEKDETEKISLSNDRNKTNTNNDNFNIEGSI